jgi:hypothetical protein
MVDDSSCPNCKCLGEYKPGYKCINCNYLDPVAYASLKAAKEIREAQVIEFKKAV